MATYTLRYKGSLASRTNAASARKEIEKFTSGNALVLLDYSEVISLSGSYADELFGIFAEHHSLSTLKKYVRVKGASANVLHAIGAAIQNRLKSSSQTAA